MESLQNCEVIKTGKQTPKNYVHKVVYTHESNRQGSDNTGNSVEVNRIWYKILFELCMDTEETFWNS